MGSHFYHSDANLNPCYSIWASPLDSEVCYHIAANQIDWSFCCSTIDLCRLLQDFLPENKRRKCLVGRDHFKVSGDWFGPSQALRFFRQTPALLPLSIMLPAATENHGSWFLGLSQIRLISSQARSEEEGDACHCPGRWTGDLFNFGLCFKSPVRPVGRTSRHKGAICFSFPAR